MKRLLKLVLSLLVRAWDIAHDARLRWSGQTPPARCVVLYYHAVEATQRRSFAVQMDILRRCTTVVRAETERPLAAGRHYSAVTFDDGFVSVLDHALPELETRDIPATLFIPSGYLGQPPLWVKAPDAPARRQQILSAEQLAALKSRRLLTLGAHTITHPRLTQLEDAQVFHELVESKQSLERILGQEVVLFSFPHGAFHERAVQLARRAGYHRVFTIEPGLALREPLEFVTGRVLVDPSDWKLEFRLKALGAYRWRTWGLRARHGADLEEHRRHSVTPSASVETFPAGSPAP